MDAVKPLNLSLGRAVEKLLGAVEIAGDVEKVIETCKFYVARNKRTTRKPVADVVTELLTIKDSRGASPRYLQDLRNRLKRFSDAFWKDACNITTAEIQAWFDSQKMEPQNHMGFRRVIHLFFEFAVARGYAVDNPAAALERVKVKHGATQIFTPKEITKLLSSATLDFLPCIAIGAFAGLRSAEIQRPNGLTLTLLADISPSARTRQKQPRGASCRLPTILPLGLRRTSGNKETSGKADMMSSTKRNRTRQRPLV